ncbi:RNA polymerase sigma factor [Gallaecimonas mangrovi]|uniref:RNA polymerase sigma factor n=1 Tax=Gallaecimonas mangrovi TaxID=2291597 RepID=UPI000E2088C3|nr:sigma-70 family RNA polymerase sigma factor [Gallaecimonas mangrovi]
MNDIDQLLTAQLPGLRRFALSLSKSPFDADDLVQTTVEKAIAGWDKKHNDGELRSWLFAILYRHFIDGQRRQSRFGKLLQLFSSEEPQSASLEQHLDQHHSLALFAQLPEAQRSILLLVSVEGMSYQQVSETLAVPIGTVMSRLSRARQAYRSLLEDKPVSMDTTLRVVK